MNIGWIIVWIGTAILALVALTLTVVVLHTAWVEGSLLFALAITGTVVGLITLAIGTFLT
jgi:hypothetical protein